MARGNTVMLVNEGQGAPRHDAVIFALRKFTGGMGDEDEDQPEDNLVWKKYFLRPYEEVNRVVCTEKANGEAAHLAARHFASGFVLFVGSKNVHMAVKNRGDIEKYSGTAFPKHLLKEFPCIIYTHSGLGDVL